MNGLIGRTISHYRILAQIGQGGMSSVFRAHDLQLDRPVALKILSPHLANDPSFQARFEREIQLLKRLQHPNIVPILDHGEAHGLAFIVMPFLATGTLHDLLQSGPLDPVQGGRIVDQLASALSLAHENGVVHRDVKPSNVLIDDQGNALLSDFSFARQADASQNLTGSALIGTPAYMSPEQCRSEPIDARSDQYSLAVMLYQISTGQLPFDGDTPIAIAMKHVNTPLPRPKAVNPHLPDGVERVLIRALAKDPALRFESVRALNEAFQAALRTALDPQLRAADARTQSAERTLAMYRKYQNVPPPAARPAPRRRYDRSAVLAALLLLLACVVSAGAIVLINPEAFLPAAAAPRETAIDVMATVNVLLTANAPQLGTREPPGAKETAIVAAVMQTIEAGGWITAPPSDTSQPAEAFATTTSTDSALTPTWMTSPTPTRTPSRTPSRTLTPSRTVTPSKTLTPSRTWTPSVTMTSGGGTSTPSSTTTPTATITVSDTLPPPTTTSSLAPPTPTTPPPTLTPPPVTITPADLTCEWSTGSPNVSDDVVSVRVYNTGELPVVVSRVTITWTGSDHLQRINWRFDSAFWSGNDPGPTVSAGTSKTVPVATYRTVEFEFWGSDFDGSASVEVDAGC